MLSTFKGDDEIFSKGYVAPPIKKMPRGGKDNCSPKVSFRRSSSKETWKEEEEVEAGDP